MAVRRHTQRRDGGLDRVLAELSVQQALDALGPCLRRGFRNPMLDADHVVRVGVVAQEFDCIPRELRRVAVLSGPAGKEPGPFAVEPLQQELQLLSGTDDQSRWCLVGQACIIAAVRTGKDHPRRRGFGDTTDGDAKGIGCLITSVHL